MNGRLESELNAQKLVEKKLESLPTYFANWYRSMKSQGVSHNTYNNYINIVMKFMKTFGNDINDINIAEISYDDIAKYIDESRYRIDKNGNVKEASPDYPKLIYHALFSFFVYMKASEKIEKNPMENMKIPKGKREKDRPQITWKDERKLLMCVNKGVGSGRSIVQQTEWKDRNLLIMSLLIYTGMRKTALSEINVEDIDIEKKILKIVDKGKITHTYFLDGDLMNLISRWMIKREHFLAGMECDALFISNRRRRLCSGEINKIIKKFTEPLNLGKVTAHDLRAAFITLQYEETNDIEAVREMVGHSSITTTQRYINKHTGETAKRNAIRNIKTNIDLESIVNA